MIDTWDFLVSTCLMHKFDDILMISIYTHDIFVISDLDTEIAFIQDSFTHLIHTFDDILMTLYTYIHMTFCDQ